MLAAPGWQTLAATKIIVATGARCRSIGLFRTAKMEPSGTLTALSKRHRTASRPTMLTHLLPQPHQTRAKMTGRGSPRLAILLVSAALTTAGFVSVPEVYRHGPGTAGNPEGVEAGSSLSGAQLPPRGCVVRDCPERAPNNGELIGTYGPGGDDRHVTFRAFPEINRVPFGGTFRFYYGISRSTASQPGAIAVRVVKVLTQQQPGNEWLDRTLLYRNEFDEPSQKDEFDGSIGRARYHSWHRGQIVSDRLRTEFHVEFREDEHTSEPASRRTSFLFERHDAVVQKAYILKYRGVGPNGTWIDFSSDFTNSYSEVYITIIDLGVAVDGSPVQWSWQFENSAS